MRNAPSSQAFTMAKSHLERNGGKSTMKKLDNFQEVVAKAIASKQIEKNISLHELVDWLGNQPIQKKVIYITYLMLYLMKNYMLTIKTSI